jgi:hypothetical protein
VVVSLIVVFLLVTTHGKSCHYNVHFSKRLVCTDDAEGPGHGAGEPAHRLPRMWLAQGHLSS